jgi:hypothetical protein
MEAAMKRAPSHARAVLLALVIMSTSAGTAPAQQAVPPPPAAAPSAPGAAEIEALRREVEELRAMIRILQEQVQALRAPEAGAPAAATTPPPLPPPEAPPAAAPAVAAPVRSQNLLNPAISAVFQAIGDTSVVRKREQNGFDLSEGELALQSVVDPYAKMDLFLSFPAGDTPEVEEGYVSTLSLPGSLQLKGGRFKSAFGKWNTLHTHAFFTVDRPDVLVQFFGEESLTNDGLSLSYLVPNPWGLYMEAVSEVGTAREGTSFNSERRALTYLEHVSAFFNTSADSTLELGLSASRGRTGPGGVLQQALADPNVPATLAPQQALASAVQGADITYKWKPRALNVYKSFLWQTEILRSHRDVETLTPAVTLAPGAVTSLGGYTYLETQLAKRWRFGVRGDLTGLPDSERAREWGASGVVRFQPSEFQELRFQIEHIRRNDEAAFLAGGDPDDTRLLFEWIPVIGAHGAHKY